MLLDGKTILITGGTGSFGKMLYPLCHGALQPQKGDHLFQRRI